MGLFAGASPNTVLRSASPDVWCGWVGEEGGRREAGGREEEEGVSEGGRGERGRGRSE